MMNQKITIRPEEHKDYQCIVSLILRSFQEGTDYSDGTDIIALVEEIRDSQFYIPELSFVAELNNEVVGHFLFLLQMRSCLRIQTPSAWVQSGNKKLLRSTKLRSNFGAGDRTRTGTLSPAVDFESTTSTIPSHRQLRTYYIPSSSK